MNNNKTFIQNKNHSRMSLSGISALFKKAVEIPDSKSRGWNRVEIPDYKFRGWTRGFTLIELLVVVLIIGILAAIALPEYEKAVQRAQGAQAITMGRSIADAANRYYLANGTYQGIALDKLDIGVTSPTVAAGKSWSVSVGATWVSDGWDGGLVFIRAVDVPDLGYAVSYGKLDYIGCDVTQKKECNAYYGSIANLEAWCSGVKCSW